LSERVDVTVGDLSIGELTVDLNKQLAEIPVSLVPGDQAYALTASVVPRSKTTLAHASIPQQGFGLIFIAPGESYEVNLDRVRYVWFLKPCSPAGEPCSTACWGSRSFSIML
jgi:hypothetical protein